MFHVPVAVVVLFNLCGTPSLPVCPVLNLGQEFLGVLTSTWQLARPVGAVYITTRLLPSTGGAKILLAGRGKKLAMA